MINSLFEKLLQEDEHIEYIIHKHWVSLIYPLAKSILLGLIAPSLMIWIYSDRLNMLMIGITWLLLGIVWTTYNFLDWHYDAFLITDQHLIEIEWDSFFKRSTNRIRYENIDNVTYSSSGIFSSVFNFSDLTIVTYAGGEKFLKNASNAKEFQNLLMNRSEKSDGETDDGSISKADLKEALKSLLQEELAEEEQLVEAAPEEKEQEIVVLEQKQIRKKKK